MTAPYSGPAVAATVTATAPTPVSVRPLAADPWDAPYFGARTYFPYQPALVGREAQTPAPADAEAQPDTTPAAAAAASLHASAPVAQVAATAATQRRGWLARRVGWASRVAAKEWAP
jgi:hypothetical protein